MVITVNRAELADGVNSIIGAVNKPIKEVLWYIKIVAENGVLRLMATDTTMTIECAVNAQMSESTEFLISGKLFNDFLSKLKNVETLELEVVDEVLTATYGKSKAKFAVLDTDEYPRISKEENSNKLSILSTDLKCLIRNTIIACAQDDTRANLKACYFNFLEDGIECASCDGFRLSVERKSIHCDNNISGTSCLVPLKCARELLRILPNTEYEVLIELNENNISFLFQNTKLSCVLLNERYIDYNKIFPKAFNTLAIVNRESFLTAIERVRVFCEYNSNRIQICLNESELSVTTTAQKGLIEEIVDGRFSGIALSIRFNCKYLLDYISVIDSEFIELSFNADNQPCVITSCENKNSKYLVLPIR